MNEELIFSVKTPDFEMDYAKFGHGAKALIIIPGLSIRSVLLAASSIRNAYKCFENEYTVYLFDRKKSIPKEYPISEMALDTAAALKAIGLYHVHVFGTSQGGMMAQYMAIQNPEMIESIVLASSTSRAEPLQLSVIDGWTKLALAHKADEFVNSFIDNCFSEAYLARYRRVLLKMYRNVTDAELDRFAVFSRACDGVNTYDSLGKIKCPVFIIGASKDKVVTYEASLKIAEKLKQEGVPYEFYTYEGYGHAAFDEAPDYKERVFAFLSKL